MTGFVTKRKKIVMVAPVHRPWGNRVIRESEILALKGFDVSAIMKAEKHFEQNGVSIIPAPAYKSRLKRFLNVPRIAIMALKERGDLYHLHNPDTLPLVCLFRLFGKKVIYDTHEDFSRRLLIRSWIPAILRPVISRLVAFLECHAARIANATLVTQPELLQRFHGRATLLRNAPYISEKTRKLVDQHLKSKGSLKKKKIFRLIYAGLISRERGLDHLIEALAILNNAEPKKEFRLWLAGQDDTGTTEELQTNPGWRYVDFLGLLKQDEMFAYLRLSDLGLAVISDKADHKTAKPSKLFEYMAFGLPFIASDFPVWRGFIEPVRCGWWVDPDHPEALAGQILWCAANPALLVEAGEEGSKFIEKFNWKKESHVLIDLYKEILG